MADAIGPNADTAQDALGRGNALRAGKAQGLVEDEPAVGADLGAGFGRQIGFTPRNRSDSSPGSREKTAVSRR
jgi:hypothetical protein